MALQVIGLLGLKRLGRLSVAGQSRGIHLGMGNLHSHRDGMDSLADWVLGWQGMGQGIQGTDVNFVCDVHGNNSSLTIVFRLVNCFAHVFSSRRQSSLMLNRIVGDNGKSPLGQYSNLLV